MMIRIRYCDIRTVTSGLIFWRKCKIVQFEVSHLQKPLYDRPPNLSVCLSLSVSLCLSLSLSVSLCLSLSLSPSLALADPCINGLSVYALYTRISRLYTDQPYGLSVYGKEADPCMNGLSVYQKSNITL